MEFQRNYLACVRSHKAALMTQKAFWNSMLRDNISFRDLQVCALPWVTVGLHNVCPASGWLSHTDTA